LSTTRTGWTYGLCVGSAGVVGAWIGGIIGDRFSNTRWKGVAAVAVALCISLPALEMAVFATNYRVCLIGIAVAQVGMTAYFGPTFSVVQANIDPRLHAVTSAIFLFGITGIGSTVGPLVVGALGDYFSVLGPAASLRWALGITAIPAGVSTINYIAAATLLCRKDSLQMT